MAECGGIRLYFQCLGGKGKVSGFEGCLVYIDSNFYASPVKPCLKKNKKPNITRCAVHEDCSLDLKLSVTSSSISALFVFEAKSHVVALNSWHLFYLSFAGGNTGIYHYLQLLVPFFKSVKWVILFFAPVVISQIGLTRSFLFEATLLCL